MKLPNKVEIAGYTWRIVKHRALVQDQFGCTDPQKGEIHIWTSAPPDLVEHTFYHEWLHAALFSLGFYDDYDREDVVDSLSNAWMQLRKQLSK